MDKQNVDMLKYHRPHKEMTTRYNLDEPKNMLSEKRHMQKDTYVIQFHFYEMSKISKSVEMESNCKWIRGLFWG